MRNKTIIGALVAVLAVLGMLIPGGNASATGSDGNDGKVCVGVHQSANDQKTFTVVAPVGKYIVSICVKAGSDKQGDGPYDFPIVGQPTSVLISHPSGKEISHWSATYADLPPVTVPPTTQPPVTTVPPTTQPPTTLPPETTQPPVTTQPPTTEPPATTQPPVTTAPETTTTEVPTVSIGTAPVPPSQPSVPPTPPTPAPVELPETGTNNGLLLLIAAGMLGAGALATYVARRKTI
jgi:LPXTG-motif cell wall-anchored protein